MSYIDVSSKYNPMDFLIRNRSTLDTTKRDVFLIMESNCIQTQLYSEAMAMLPPGISRDNLERAKANPCQKYMVVSRGRSVGDINSEEEINLLGYGKSLHGRKKSHHHGAGTEDDK
jgi:hypothetical protein